MYENNLSLHSLEKTNYRYRRLFMRTLQEVILWAGSGLTGKSEILDLLLLWETLPASAYKSQNILTVAGK